MLSDNRGFFAALREQVKSRLTRRIVFYVFASILVIEGILLIPSVKRREKELLAQLKEVSNAKVTWILASYPNASDEELLKKIEELKEMELEIVGGYLYSSDGKNVGSFGEQPELLLSDNKTELQSKNGNRYDVLWSGEQLQLPMDKKLIIRHNSSFLKGELLAYILRIGGLVLIIATFTTVTIWVVLDAILITPIFKLRCDLIAAGEAISQDKNPPEFYSAELKRQDELGDVIIAFQKMFGQITEAIILRKQAEAALQESLTKVEAYSSALNHELEKGREIQKNFLPSEILQKPGWEIVSFFQPARQVAGDFYDVFELPCDGVGIVIADVCDKGVGAALFMSLFRSLIRIFSGQTYLEGVIEDNHQDAQKSALKAVKLTNNYIAQNHGELGMFATLFFGVLDPITGRLTYINGGHEPLFIIQPSGGIKQQLKSTGPAVGILLDPNFKIEETYLEPGEILLGYTDGVPEARAADGKFFTGEKLMSMLKETAPSATALVNKIAGKVLEHTGAAEQFDDITMLAVQRLS